MAIGQSTLATQRVKANLFYRGLTYFRFPVIGDTLYTRTEVVGLKQNSAKPGRAPTGLAALRMTTIDQADRLVLDFYRCAMLPLSPDAPDTGHADDLSRIGADPPMNADPTADWDAEAFRTRVPGPHFDADLVGAVLTSTGDVVSSAPELARLSLNIAATHHDSRVSGQRLVYGGHTIGLALAQATRLLPNLVTVLGWESCDHSGPVCARATRCSARCTSRPRSRCPLVVAECCPCDRSSTPSVSPTVRSWTGDLASCSSEGVDNRFVDGHWELMRREWGASGLAHLTGSPSGRPDFSRAAVLGRARATADELGRRLGVTVDAGELLSGRAALLGLSRGGTVSAGGATRLLAARDGWCALTLSRPDDVGAVPALVEVDAAEDDPWTSVQRWAAGRATTEVAERARLLGLPVAALGETPAAAPGVRGSGPVTAPREPSELLVVDLSSMWAGPLCWQLLRIAGATVVKVEIRGQAGRHPRRFTQLLRLDERWKALLRS